MPKERIEAPRIFACTSRAGTLQQSRRLSKSWEALTRRWMPGWLGTCWCLRVRMDLPFQCDGLNPVFATLFLALPYRSPYPWTSFWRSDSKSQLWWTCWTAEKPR